MSGSRLGRGRGARLAVYVGCGVVLLLLGFFYRAATSEMARLRELHVQCAHQQEALAAQLQVIFEYKVRLEKSLAEEKTSNTAVKQELQQRASREKSLRDKDSIEAMQRYNSLQQTYKILNTEHKDFQEECKKREKQALEDTSRLESTLQDLRSRIKQAREDKEKSMEHLKNKYLELENEKNKQEERYNQMMQNHANVEEANLHRDKEVFQLKHELEEAKKFCKGVFPSSSLASPQSVQVKPQTHDKSVGAQSGIEGSNHRHHQQHQQSTAESSLKEVAEVLKLESSTKPGASTSTDKALLPIVKPMSRLRIPSGVLPIPNLINSNENQDEQRQEEVRRKSDVAQNSALKDNRAEDESKEKDDLGDVDLQDGPFPPGRHIGEQIVGRRDNERFRVQPGVQEIGDDNHLQGLDDGIDRHGGDAGEDQYDGDYEKEQQRKNNDLHLEGEEEGEEEDDQEYPHNVKQDKHV